MLKTYMYVCMYEARLVVNKETKIHNLSLDQSSGRVR